MTDHRAQHQLSPLRTERLLLRGFEAADVDFVLALHQSPDLARFVPQAALEDLDGARATLDRFRRVEEPDRGWWCVTRDGRAVAAVLLRAIPASAGRDLHDVEIGWRQLSGEGGRGYVTEAAHVVLQRGFDTGLKRVVAVTDPDNGASQRVCQRLGMSGLGPSGDYYDRMLELFEVHRR